MRASSVRFGLVTMFGLTLWLLLGNGPTARFLVCAHVRYQVHYRADGASSNKAAAAARKLGRVDRVTACLVAALSHFLVQWDKLH
jgi:hypothetical protein